MKLSLSFSGASCPTQQTDWLNAVFLPLLLLLFYALFALGAFARVASQCKLRTAAAAAAAAKTSVELFALRNFVNVYDAFAYADAQCAPKASKQAQTSAEASQAAAASTSL